MPIFRNPVSFHQHCPNAPQEMPVGHFHQTPGQPVSHGAARADDHGPHGTVGSAHHHHLERRVGIVLLATKALGDNALGDLVLDLRCASAWLSPENKVS